MFPIHVKTASGLEPLLAQELKNIGLTQIKVKNRLVIGLGDLKLLYQINLWSRTAIRALLPLTNFNASDEKSFYDQVKALDWSPWIKETGTLAIDAHVHSSFTTHSLFLAQLTKDAIADHFREKTGTRPSVDLENPDLRIAVNLFRNQVEIFLDSSGDSLHKRGYRQKTGEAPLNETLAAGIIQLTRWDGTLPLVDPMTGSGTLAIEAALIAKNIAPGLLKREFGFQKWKDYDPQLFEELVQTAKSSIKETLPEKILAFDCDPEMIAIANENIARAGVTDCIKTQVKDFLKWENIFQSPGVVVMNPPYDQRLAVEDLAKFCSEIGEKLNTQFSNWKAFVLMGNPDAAKEINRNPQKIHLLYNGSIECQLLEITPSLQQPVPINPKWDSKINNFNNRLKKNFKHYSKWAQRERITNWRIYDRDIPELPFIVDLYGKHIHLAEVPRNHDDSPLEHLRYLELIKETVSQVTQVPLDRIFLKIRKAQKLPKTETFQALEVKERGYKFLVNFIDYVDVGLFLEFRKVREWVEKEAQGKDFLNLYSYTGTATVCAAAGGAKSTGSVDASSTYLDWAKRNMALNQLKGNQHIYYRSDVMEFLNNSKKVYDFCWVDPPVQSVNRIKGSEFNIQEDHVTLLKLVLERIRPNGKVLFTTHGQSFQLNEWALKESCSIEIQDMSHPLTPNDFERTRPFKAWLLQKKL